MDLKRHVRNARPRARENAARDFLRELFEEHIEELAILWRLRTQRLGSPEHRLLDLVRLDERLDAHADAAVAAGEPATHLLTLGLGSNDAVEVFASAYLILRAGLHRLSPLLREMFGQADAAPQPLEGLRDALVHAPGSTWLDVLEPHARAADRVLAVAMEVSAFRGALHAGRAALPWIFAHEEPFVRAYGWRAVAHGIPVSDDAWARGFEDASPGVRSLALQAAAWQGRASVIVHLRDVARSASSPDETSLLVFAWLAGDDDLRTVLQAASRLPNLKQQAHVLSALGHPSVIPSLIDMVTHHDPRTAVASSLALTRMTGWDIDSQHSTTLRPEDAPPGDEVAEAFDEVFVMPDADRARAAWHDQQRRFAAGTRWSRGIDISGGLPREGLRYVDLESLKACCLRARLHGTTGWSAARLEAFPQQRA